MSNNFDPKGSFIELDSKIFPISKNFSYTCNDAQSCFLHEYLHYIQDSSTYYGVKYKSDLIDNCVEKNVSGVKQLNAGFCIGMRSIFPYTFAVNNYKFFLNNDVLGGISVKENMAVMAQHIVYKTVLLNRPAFYYEISEYIKDQTSCTDSFSCFVIEDCSLMSEDPGKAIITLCNKLQNVKSINTLNDCHELYDNCYEILKNNDLLRDISTFKLDNVKYCENLMAHIGGLMYGKRSISGKEEDDLTKVCQCIATSYENNMKKRRENKYIIGDALLNLKNSKDISKLIDVFGMPFIIEEGNKSNNKDFFIKSLVLCVLDKLCCVLKNIKTRFFT
ncbi:MAG: hypothetical protein J5875_09405 [Paludibacteraceae bacterium]|nr:hypothetical protein [Paludibacteraceae bacterium]